MGLKEKIIIGKLIPAGTGTMAYRDVELEMPDCQPMAGWPSDMGEGEDLSEWLVRKSTSDQDAAEALSWLGGSVPGGDGAASDGGADSGSEESAS